MKPGENEPQEDKYFKAAQSWDDDMRIRTRRSAAIAWSVAGISAVVALATCGVIVKLLPLKTVEPYVVRVESVTGAVDIIRALDREHMEYDEAVNRYFLWQYVNARETFQPSINDGNYDRVVLMSVPAIKDQYVEFMDKDNADGPQQIFGNRASVHVKLKTISFPQKNVALVRYARSVNYLTEQADETSDWIATVTFAFHPEAAMRDEDRLINPLGFQVEDIRTDREPSGGAS